MNKPILLVLAAGLGSRYGGMKQTDAFGKHGESILEYTIYDAIQVGFQKVVLVIREEMLQEMKETLMKKIGGYIDVGFAIQKPDDLPEGYTVPEDRQKPWGTGHAVLAAAAYIDQPFAIVNADDFYGRNSLKMMHNQLMKVNNDQNEACMVGFVLENTLSDHGSVSRGICKLMKKGYLEAIEERSRIFKDSAGAIHYEEKGISNPLTGKEIVSMNLMGFTSTTLEVFSVLFREFLSLKGDDTKSEFFISTVLNHFCQEGFQVPVLISREKWFGVTYQEDKTMVRQNLSDLVDQGFYPEFLWG